jgi:hypothetical protein
MATDKWWKKQENFFARLEREARESKEKRIKEIEEGSKKRQRGRTNGPIVNSVWTLRK